MDQEYLLNAEKSFQNAILQLYKEIIVGRIEQINKSNRIKIWNTWKRSRISSAFNGTLHQTKERTGKF